MATNFISDGNYQELTAPVGGVVSGRGYKIGRFFGVATNTADAGAKTTLALVGVWNLLKVTLEPWTEGLLLYFNTGSSLVTSVSTTAILIGAAVRTEASGTTSGYVRLNGIAEFTNQ